ncbi:MAG TPA: hypothetical protein VHC44_04500 [Verrucomicrobiae bacterium]|nr:hypothetical protein [Verrucomicrobiae bacterium]
MAFLILAALAILGGVIYPGTNYDGLAYRLPRTLHWLAEGHWHWIHTDFDRVNNRGAGIEWVSAPIMAFMRTDRLLFLLNAVSFLLLPGLIFSVFTRLGVRTRVAWYWMWPLSCGCCFLLQAGSIGNDLFTVPFALAAIDYALRSHQQKSLGALWLSILSAGLLTGIKANTVPLGLPYVIALLPGWRMWGKKAYVTVAVCLVAIVISFISISYFNVVYAGDWTGGTSSHIATNKSRLIPRLTGNVVILAINGFTPPIAPFANWWNNHISARIAATTWGKAIDADFSSPVPIFEMSEMDTEEGAGLGFGCYLLVGATLAAVLWNSRNRAAPGTFRPLPTFVNLGTYASLLVFFVSSDYMSIARLLAPYYPLLLIPLLMIVNEKLVRRRWWQVVALSSFVLAALPLIASPPRPLFPWRPVVALLQKLGASPRLTARTERVYSVYSHRADAFAPMIPLLPPGTTVVGLVTYDDPEAALWKPYGSRRVVHVCQKDSGDFIRSEGVKYILVSSEKFHMNFEKPLEQWLAEINGTIVATKPLSLRAGEGSVDWYWVRLN